MNTPFSNPATIGPDDLRDILARYSYEEYCAMVPPGTKPMDAMRFRWTKVLLREVISDQRSLAARQAELEQQLLLA